eukprot:Rhum_TRINITY_DN2989_c0_g1::Rhum_TRINITY_DN2989_c0_g1_i1::g.9112::m.9112/K07074/K07074; uncharacterized protein
MVTWAALAGESAGVNGLSAVVRATLNRALLDVARVQGITCVFAAVVGSRAKGLAGPTSDYDVRVVFRRSGAQGEWGQKELPMPSLDGDLDVVAWNEERFAALLAECNVDAVDALRSPHVVLSVDGFYEMHSASAAKNFCFSSYGRGMLSNAQANYKRFVAGADDVSVSDYLHVVHPLLGFLHTSSSRTLPPFLYNHRVCESADLAGCSAIPAHTLHEHLMRLAYLKREDNKRASRPLPRSRVVNAFLSHGFARAADAPKARAAAEDSSDEVS